MITFIENPEVMYSQLRKGVNIYFANLRGYQQSMSFLREYRYMFDECSQKLNNGNYKLFDYLTHSPEPDILFAFCICRDTVCSDVPNKYLNIFKAIEHLMIGFDTDPIFDTYNIINLPPIKKYGKPILTNVVMNHLQKMYDSNNIQKDIIINLWGCI